jgi:branched-chain amino acid transport system ATP-binding protein
MLTIHALNSHYGTSHVIQGIDLIVAPGEVVGVFGRNGVGKTTLLKTIAGWVKATSGTIEFDGQRLDRMRADRISRAGVGFVPEDRRIFPGLSVEENLTLGFLQVPQRSSANSRAALNSVYSRLPRLQERRHQQGTTLSGGEQQMLAIARVMLGEPKLLLIDEPSEGLAPMIVAEIYDILSEMKTAGRAILLVEQSVSRALDLCDRFIAIERGQVVLAGDPASSRDRELLLSTIAV